MGTPTTNYGFQKPSINGDSGSWGGELNASLDSIDSNLKTVSNTASAAIPNTGGTATGRITANGAPVARVDLGSKTGTVTLDLSAAEAFTVSLSGGATFVFSNPASGSVAEGFLLYMTGGGTGAAPIWPGNTRWHSGSPPAFSTGTDLVAFITFDGGAHWNGVLVSQDLR